VRAPLIVPAQRQVCNKQNIDWHAQHTALQSHKLLTIPNDCKEVDISSRGSLNAFGCMTFS